MLLNSHRSFKLFLDINNSNDVVFYDVTGDVSKQRQCE